MVLKWARKNGCPWNEDTCNSAARSGHLAVLQRVYDNGCPMNSNLMCINAEYSGYLAVLKWARKNCCHESGIWECVNAAGDI